ncbi:hypothetical protein BCV70DRAFT_205695 [Testicularia cyperi]|uniref:Fork-head domain-containing protein n=1 Tax=Testicularia cyperi TaxID=1882483 RepID=A0A317XUP2_9BASI|nr:hypothetical protein BCV70DRAFT_205695 [Testicularia cyperi]
MHAAKRAFVERLWSGSLKSGGFHSARSSISQFMRAGWRPSDLPGHERSQSQYDENSSGRGHGAFGKSIQRVLPRICHVPTTHVSPVHAQPALFDARDRKPFTEPGTARVFTPGHLALHQHSATMTTPSNLRSFSSGSSSYHAASSEYSPTSTSTPFATPATRATSIAPSTFSRSGPGNRRAKAIFTSLTGETHNEDLQTSPTPAGSRSGTPASMEAPAATSSAPKLDEKESSPTSALPRNGQRVKIAAPTKKPSSATVPAATVGTSKSSTAASSSSMTSASSAGTKVGNSAGPSGMASSSELGKDAEDFFARAQAMGLRLTREDYERTKAGVAAFLKAERKPNPALASSSNSTGANSRSVASTSYASSSSTTPSVSSSFRAPTTSLPSSAEGAKKESSDGTPSTDTARVPDAKTSSASTRLPAPSPLSRPSGSLWTRNAGSPGLSFFSAVVEPESSPGSSKSHPSLDEAGSAEEKRRQKLKKIKTRERRERQRAALAASSNTAGLLDTPGSSAMQSSPEVGGSEFKTPPARAVARRRTSSGAKLSSARVGLGLELEGSDSNTSPDPTTPPEGLQSSFRRGASRGRTVSFEAASPLVRVSDEVRACTSLEELSRRAWVSPKGTLRLLRSPVEDDAMFQSTPMEADDSGVFFDNEDTTCSVPCGGLAADGWGANHRRVSSSGSIAPAASASAAAAPATSDETLDAKMSRLNVLDQVMAQQTSPRRLYKEAKLREKQERTRKEAEERSRAELAAKQIADIAARAEIEQNEAAKAAAAADAIKAANPDYASLVTSTPNAASKAAQSGPSPASAVKQTPLNASSSRALRWSTIGTSPSNLHARMTTREHYDFTMHGISPGQPSFDSLDSLCNINATPGPITFSTWDAEPLTSLRKGTGGRGNVSSTPAAHYLLSSDEGRPELIGVSPSVANFFHARQASSQGSMQAKLMRSASEGVAVMSPLSGRLVPGVASRIADLDFDADDDVHMHEESDGPLGKAPTFNARRGLLFAPPGGTALDPPPSNGAAASGSAASAAGLMDSPAKLNRTHEASSPARLGRSLRGGAFGDEMIGGKLPFASPRSALVRAQSGSVLEARRERQPSESIRDLLGNGAVGAGARHKRAPSRKGLVDSFDTISPADVFGSSLPRPLQLVAAEPQPPLPEPSKAMREAALDAAAPDASTEVDDSTGPTGKTASRSSKKKAVRKARSLSPPAAVEVPVLITYETTDDAASVGPSATSVQLGLSAVTVLRAGSAEPVLSSPPRAATITETPVLVSQIAPQTDATGLPSSTKKGKKAKTAGSSSSANSTPAAFRVVDLPCQNFEHMAQAAPSVQNGDEIGWDQADGSRLVKLVSEELRAALEAGTLAEEPPARYYLLPPGFGQSKAKPSSVSYAGLIGQAIKSSSDMRLSLAEVYDWISSTYPFFEKGDRGWQNSIRHNLSLNKSFMKIEREANMPGKGGWWGIKPGHEDRFQNGLYNAVPQKFEAAKARQQQQQQQQTHKTSQSDVAQGEASPTAVEMMLSGGSDAIVEAPTKADKAAKKRSKAKRKKTEEDDGESGAEDSDKETSAEDKARLTSAKRSKTAAQLVQADRLPLLETQPLAQQGQHHMMAMGGYDSITPIRPHTGGSSVYGSSVAGSQYSKTVPMLTDSASSPPSSPLTLMPPPSMQITADHSARKRKMAGQANGTLGFGTGFSPSMFGMQASPLNAVRNNAYRNARGSVLGGAFAFSNQMDSDASRGSPLRRQAKLGGGEDGGSDGSVGNNAMVTSPKRLWSMSSPTSSMRGSMPGFGTQKMGQGELMRSPSSARVAAALAHSPIRGSPLRSGASGMLGGTASPNSSLQMQLAMGAGQSGFGGISFGTGLGMGVGRPNGSLRYATGFSPGRRGQMAQMGMGAGGGQSMQQQQHPQQQQQQQGQSGWYLDDPFELQAGFQHLHHQQQQQHQHPQQHQQQQHHHMHGQPQLHGMDMSGAHFTGFGATSGVNNSPLRMAWNSIQAAGGIQAFTGSNAANFSHLRP